MKKSLLALAVLSSFAGVAAAQSSVTIYGILDAGIVYDKNITGADNNWRLASGQQSGSRLGFRGREDLGGGTAAIFTLENGFNVDTGTTAQGGRLFGRQAWVGLQGGFGAVKLGRQNTELYRGSLAIDPFQFGLTGALYNYFGYGLYGADPFFRFDNAINYTTPDFGGLTGSVSYGFGEQAGAFSTARQASAGLGYVNGPINVQFAYQDSKDAPLGATTTALGVAGAVADLRTAFLGGTWDFGVAKAHLAFAETEAEAITGGIDTKNRNYLVGVSAPIGPGTVMASWIRNDIRALDEGASDNFAIGYSHPLSKRTNVYTALGYTKNEDAVRLNAFANGEDSHQVQVGVRHVF